MSDSLRQDPVDKATSAMKPESEKSTLEKAGDSVKGTADNIAGTAQPEGDKSMAQKASDTVSGSGNDAGKEGQSILDKAKDTLGMNK